MKEYSFDVDMDFSFIHVTFTPITILLQHSAAIVRYKRTVLMLHIT